MYRLIALAAFIFVITTSAQAMPIAPVHEPDGVITLVVAGCGPGMTRVNGVCVSRHAKRQAPGVCPGMEPSASDGNERQRKCLHGCTGTPLVAAQ